MYANTQPFDIEITADDRKARPAIERTNSSLERIEKAAEKMTRAGGKDAGSRGE